MKRIVCISRRQCKAKDTEKSFKNCFGNFVQAQETRDLAPLAAYGLQKYRHLKQEVQLHGQVAEQEKFYWPCTGEEREEEEKREKEEEKREKEEEKREKEEEKRENRERKFVRKEQ
jgi:hypothetical protein